MDGWMDGGYYFKDIILTPLTNCYFNIATFTWDGVRRDKNTKHNKCSKATEGKIIYGTPLLPKEYKHKKQLESLKIRIPCTKPQILSQFSPGLQGATTCQCQDERYVEKPYLIL